MRQPKFWQKMKNYYNRNESVQIVVGLFVDRKPVFNPNDSVQCGNDCRNFHIDQFQETMEEINNSTDADTDDEWISAGATRLSRPSINEASVRHEQRTFFKVDDLFITRESNIKGTIIDQLSGRSTDVF